MSTKPWDAKEVGNQILHVLLGFFCSLPIIGGFFGTIAREYYQTKGTMHEVYRIQFPDLNWKQIEAQLTFGTVMEKVDLLKRDLVFSYIGIALCTVGMITVFWVWFV